MTDGGDGGGGGAEERAESRGGARKPKPCISCRQRVVAWTRPRVDYCYMCLPGGPFTPPPCRRCGSLDYYSQGLCDRCHLAAPQSVASCRDCLAWGVIRKHKWLCWRCRSWRARRPHGTCRICGRVDLPLDDGGHCQLCDRQTAVHLGTTLEQANRHGQQLYLANVPWPAAHYRPTSNGPVRRLEPPAAHPQQRPRQGVRGQGARPGERQSPQPRPWQRTVTFYPVPYRQLTLVDLRPDLAAVMHGSVDSDPPNQQMAAFLDAERPM